MTPLQHNEQRDAVRASLLVDAARETHRDVYGRRQARVRVLLGAVDASAVAESIRDLGCLLAAAEGVQERSWLVLRLRNRLDVLDVLEGRS